MVTLLILDGFGERSESFGNAIKSQGTPFLDKLKKKFLHTKLHASESFVGLPDGQFGNSEVGHLTIGSGRVVLQDLKLINTAIQTKEFENNQNLNLFFEEGKKKGFLHLMGLVSDGGVHSHIDHLIEILKIAKKKDVEKIYIHAIADGRDVSSRSFLTFLEKLSPYLNDDVCIASLAGRFFAMDRERVFDRTKKYYESVVLGKNLTKKSVREWVEDEYASGGNDEFFQPVLFDENSVLKDGDPLLFFNFRPDRAKQFLFALTDEKFSKFKTKKIQPNCFSMTEIDEKLTNVKVLFDGEKVEYNLAKILSDSGKKQFHISETTKYAHVTYFLNGGFEKPYENEERCLIESIETQHLEDFPQMKASEITERVLEEIASLRYDFLVVNLSNCDMIGHTGNFNATKEAVKIVDKCAYAIALANLMVGGECVIVSDHGNADLMFDKNGNKVTSHSSSPVPFILVSNKKRRLKKIKDASLANVAPTILKMMDIQIPKEMHSPII